MEIMNRNGKDKVMGVETLNQNNIKYRHNSMFYATSIVYALFLYSVLSLCIALFRMALITYQMFIVLCFFQFGHSWLLVRAFLILSR